MSTHSFSHPKHFNCLCALSAFSGAATALASGLPDAKTSADNWMLVFPAGVSMARDGRGPFITGDINSLQAIIERTLKMAGTTEVMVDYDHQLHYSAVPGVGGTALAAGWVKEFQAKPDGIWARIEWTEAAAAKIKAREYRYLSPLFTSNEKGQVGQILNIGLVNRPALDRLEAIAAQAKNSQTENNSMNIKAILKALGLPEDASEADVLAAIEKWKSKASNAMSALSLGEDADEEAIKAAVVALSADNEGLKTIALAAGLDEKADVKTIAASVTAAVSTGDAKTITALQSELTQTATALATLKGTIATDKATAFVDAAIKQGRVGVKPMRDHYIKRHAASADSAEAVEAELNALPKLSGSGTEIVPPAPKEGEVALSAAQMQAATLLGIDPKDYAETLKDEQRA
jgi:phage I-like protein